MARLFDNNAANYMSRASVNLGLDGVTACSWAYWVKITATSASSQRILAKEINGQNGWATIFSGVPPTGTVLTLELDNFTANTYAYWSTTSGIGTGVWTRALFTWARTSAAAATDAVIYINGQSVAITQQTGTGYTNTFTPQENSSNLYYGLQPVALTQPFNGALDWVCIWNRQLTAQEALLDYTNPRNVTNGLISRVRLGDTDPDEAYGGNMTVTGTVWDVTGNVPIRAAMPMPYATRVRPKPFAPGLAR